MSELKPLPCPFCGGAPQSVERPDNIDGTRFFYALACYCGGYSACAHKMAVEPTPEQAKRTAIEAWNRRAQPAQAVPITSESGNQAAQGASGITSQAVPVLTDDALWELWNAQGCDDMNQSEAMSFARAIEQAVRAKLGVAVPMTDPELVAAIKAAGFKTWDSRMWELKRQIEAHHGIVGKEGA